MMEVVGEVIAEGIKTLAFKLFGPALRPILRLIGFVMLASLCVMPFALWYFS